MVKVSQRDLAIIAGLAGVVDILTEHRFTIPLERAVKRALAKITPIAARQTAAFIPRALGTARLVALRHPAVALGAVIYVGWQEREKIRTLLEQGYDIVEAAGPARQEALMDVAPLPFTDFKVKPLPGVLPETFLGKKRRPSAFNKAVAAGMNAIKKSTSYGGKGKIKPAKRAFSVVVKLASAKKKKKKAPKSGIRRRIWNAMKGLR